MIKQVSNVGIFHRNVIGHLFTINHPLNFLQINVHVDFAQTQ